MTNEAYLDHTIDQGSKSFAKAARLFDPATRRSALELYAWCRHADDVIDGQTLGHGLQTRSRDEMRACLNELEEQTRRSLNGQSVTEPAFQALQQVAQRHALPPHYPFELLEGFAMDAEGRRYADLEALLPYCYHVAGVVGAMMAWIMGARGADTLNRAIDLGIAFQLTNIARDVMDDAATGRVYLPLSWLGEIPHEPKQWTAAHQEALHNLACRLLDAAEPYYASARIGLGRLPFRSAWAIATALGVYRAIGIKLRRGGPQAWANRVHTSRWQKWLHAGKGAGLALYGVTLGGRNPSPRTGLWTRQAAYAA